MKRCRLCIVLLISLNAFSQKQGQAFIDSLESNLLYVHDDSAKCRLYLQMADRYIDINLDKAMLCADSGAFLAEKSNWNEGIAASKVMYGNIYNFKGDYDKAISSIHQGYALYEALGNKKEMGHAIYALGMSYERLSNYSEAVHCAFESLYIFESIPGCERQSGNSLSMIAVIYFLQKDFKKSVDYSLRALQKQQIAKNTIGVANEMAEMADTYYELHDSANAVKYNRNALAVYDQLGDKFGQALVNYQLGRVYHNRYDTALKYLFTAERLFNELSDRSNTYATNAGEIGRILLSIAKKKDSIPLNISGKNLTGNKEKILKLADDYLQRAVTISRQTGDVEDEVSFSADLSDVQAMKGDYKNAYYNFKKYQESTDSIFSQENKNRIAAIESQQLMDLKNKQIENEQLQIGNQQKRMWLLLSFIIFLSVIGTVLYRQALIRKKSNAALKKLNIELDEANHVKARFFGIISHDLRSPVANLINYMQLQKRKPGMLNIEQMAARENKITESATSLLETMETMLLWSKGQMENFKPVITEIQVSELFNYLKKFFASVENIQFRFDGENNLLIRTDMHYLQTIMANLTANAIKILEKIPGAEIQWKAWKSENNIFFSIKDNGAGAMQEEFKPLYEQTEISGSRSGLGLHIIRDLAKAIGCTVSVNSIAGKGTEISLSGFSE